MAIASVGASLGLLFVPSRIQAAPALCFLGKSGTGATAFRGIACDDPSYKALFEWQVGVPAADACYLVGADSGNIERQPAGSPVCGDWRSKAAATAATPPSCVRLAGTVSEWQEGKLSSNSQITKVPCDDALLQEINQSGTPLPNGRFMPGSAYLIYKKDGGGIIAVEKEANEALQELVTYQQVNTAKTTTTYTATDVERDKVRNCTKDKSVQDCLAQNPIIEGITVMINLISAAVGIIVVITVIIGGIQYMTAGPNPTAVAAAKKRIINGFEGLLAMMFLYAILQWLIPGGPF